MDLRELEWREGQGTDSQVEDTSLNAAKFSSLGIWGYIEGVSKSRLQGWYRDLFQGQ